MSDSNLIFIRTDSSITIGIGHTMRCLTLAGMLRDSGDNIEFITRDHSGNLNDFIISNGFTVHLLPSPIKCNSQCDLVGYEQWLGVKQEVDAQETIQELRGIQPDLLIIDHYAIDQLWEVKLRPYAKKILVIDDLANRKHDCDYLLDQNYFPNQNRYENLVSPDTIKLLGPKYALIRKSFIENQTPSRKIDKVNRVFIFYGGSDFSNLTTISLKALLRHDLAHLSVDVVIGNANLHQEELEKIVRAHQNIELFTQVENIAELMAKSDIALGGGGTTTWERMALGLPSIVITVAENQIAFNNLLDQEGYIKWLGNADQVDENTIHQALLDAIQNTNNLNKQSCKGQKLVEGMGTQLLAKLLTVGIRAENLKIRRTKVSDCLLYWHWANDTDVRKNSLNQHTIKWEDHQIWFDSRLNDSDTIMLIIECNFGPVGQVRFNYSDSHFMINYSIARQFRGFSLGKAILSKAINTLRQERNLILIGDVKRKNQTSIKIFKQLGFKQTTHPSLKGMVRFKLHCTCSTIDNEK